MLFSQNNFVDVRRLYLRRFYESWLSLWINKVSGSLQGLAKIVTADTFPKVMKTSTTGATVSDVKVLEFTRFPLTPSCTSTVIRRLFVSRCHSRSYFVLFSVSKVWGLSDRHLPALVRRLKLRDVATLTCCGCKISWVWKCSNRTTSRGLDQVPKKKRVFVYGEIPTV